MTGLLESPYMIALDRGQLAFTALRADVEKRGIYETMRQGLVELRQQQIYASIIVVDWHLVDYLFPDHAPRMGETSMFSGVLLSIEELPDGMGVYIE